MRTIFLVWAIITTILSGVLFYKYDKKACVENKVVNVIDSVYIYMPYGTGISMNGYPGIPIPKISQSSSRVILMPQYTRSPLTDSYGIGIIYSTPRWNLSYSYDLLHKSHTFGAGITIGN